MTTKEQEHKALAKIREIVNGLGDDSYIGTALTGCLEDAETNIYNDWALSMYDRWQSAEQKLEEAQTALSEVADKLIDEGQRADGLQADLDAMKEYSADARKSLDTALANANDLHRDLIEVEAQLRARDDEIIRLKAKLYDMMTAGA